MKRFICHNNTSRYSLTLPYNPPFYHKSVCRIGALLLTFTLFQGCFVNQSSSDREEFGRAYYLSENGNDAYQGTKEMPWQTISKLNSIAFSPGDTLMFEAGSTFQGTIELNDQDSGTDAHNLVITSFGNSPAIIDGEDQAGLMGNNCDHLTIKNIIFKGSGRKTGNSSNGVHLENCDSLTIDEVEVYGFQHAGLHIHKTIKATITLVYAHNNGFAGIHITGTTINDPVNYDNRDIYIGYCITENNPGDPTVTTNHSGNGILASSVKRGIIEYCESFNNGWDMPWTGNGPVGIWIWDATEFVIQHCISHHNKTAKGAADGGGFDFDGGVSNSILQYNLSYENEGPGIGLFEFGAAKPWMNNIVRYNISQNDALNGAGSIGIWKGKGEMRNCEIYNNTIYNSNPNGHVLWVFNNWPGFHFYNNIFVYNGSFLPEKQTLKEEKFIGNLYWNLQGELDLLTFNSIQGWASSTGNEMMNGHLIGRFTDPLLNNPGKINITDPLSMNRDNLNPYCPSEKSIAIDNGIDLKRQFGLDTPVSDVAGSPIPQGKTFDIGALERWNHSTQ